MKHFAKIDSDGNIQYIRESYQDETNNEGLTEIDSETYKNVIEDLHIYKYDDAKKDFLLKKKEDIDLIISKREQYKEKESVSMETIKKLELEIKDIKDELNTIKELLKIKSRDAIKM